MKKITDIQKERMKIFFLVLTFLTLLDLTTTFIAIFFLGKFEVIPFNSFFINNFGLIGGLLISLIVRIPINFAVSFFVKDYFWAKIFIIAMIGGGIIFNLI